jgi:CBS-domain-containing membrane protein
MSARALKAAFVLSPQKLETFVVISLALQTDFRSAGSEYSLTAPRRQPGGVATANCASAKKVAAKMDLASMLAKFVDYLSVQECWFDRFDESGIERR